MTKLIKAGDFSRRYVLARQKAADIVYGRKEQTCRKCGAEFIITDEDFKKLSILYDDVRNDFEASMTVSCPTCNRQCPVLDTMQLEAKWEEEIQGRGLSNHKAWYNRLFR
jgi:predicted molibdopterin-dependent oxidoreductase YjgC